MEHALRANLRPTYVRVDRSTRPSEASTADAVVHTYVNAFGTTVVHLLLCCVDYVDMQYIQKCMPSGNTPAMM